MAGEPEPTAPHVFCASQEALANSPAAMSLIATYAPTAACWGTQMVSGFNNNCTTLYGAGVTYGANLGATFEQPYPNNFSACASTIASMSAAMGGP